MAAGRPPMPAASISQWVGMKLRWGLAVADVELAALENAASSCPDQKARH
ncbi:hypothetical protein ACFZAV_21730 [Streptomyces sp. NPDC008343]